MKKLKVFAAPYLVWMAVFIVVPLLMVVILLIMTIMNQFNPDDQVLI